MKSTKKTSVREVAPGVYRVTGVGAQNAMTGRYVRAVTAARNPGGTVTEATSDRDGSGSRSRSASTGRYVTATTARNPGGTVTEDAR